MGDASILSRYAFDFKLSLIGLAQTFQVVEAQEVLAQVAINCRGNRR